MSTFSELLALVSKNKRTDRALVLLALWCKLAVSDDTAVSTGAVADELRARLRGKAPRNVSDVLGKAAVDVERVQDGTRTPRWYLTQTGLQRLQVLGVPASIVTQSDGVAQFDYDVALVCALHDPELTALLKAFGGEGSWSKGPSIGQHIYKTTTHVTPLGDTLRIVSGAPTYMGLTATAILATQMILLFRPRFIAMVGIAAGTRSTQRGYGDVLVADPSVDYASGKVSYHEGSEIFQPDPFPLPIHVGLRTIVQEDARTRAGLDSIKQSWPGPRPESELRVHIGPVGAADQVVDSRARVVEVQRNWRKLIGLEMETYALYRAAHEAPYPRPVHASFKSVCDFAAEKSDAWQGYAAHCAAQYEKRFFDLHWPAIRRMVA